MTELSPAAQAVVDALYMEELNGPQQLLSLFHAAADLEAVADQVVPEQVEPPCGETEPWPQGYQLMSDAQWEKCQQLRSELLAIAAELCGTTTPTKTP